MQLCADIMSRRCGCLYIHLFRKCSQYLETFVRLILEFYLQYSPEQNANRVMDCALCMPELANGASWLLPVMQPLSVTLEWLSCAS
jgi:hypothetical protein